MSNKKNIKTFLSFLAATLIVSTTVSCNSKSSDDETQIAVTPALVAVKNFYIKANNKVLSKLDSVFFSIDLNTGVIFNADSLPKATNVTRLVPSITFANTMSKAELVYLDDKGNETTVNYLTNPDDSINFSNPVYLNVTAADGVNSFSYQIRVNVHLQEPDSLVWSRIESAALPSRFPDTNPVAQKTISLDKNVYCFVEEYNGEYTLARAEDINEWVWNLNSITPGQSLNVRSFNATSENFYILTDSGSLLTSTDAIEWTDTGITWTSMIGSYGNSVLGINEIEGNYVYTCYPEFEGFTEKRVENNFPIYQSSSLGVIESQWADSPIAIVMGGKNSDGQLVSDVWAFDGSGWAVINQGYLPELASPILIRYIVYRDTNYAFVQRAFDVWMIFGGYLGDGSMNRKVYISYDNGVNWKLAPEEMQLSKKIPDLFEADAIVMQDTLSADLSDAWTWEYTYDTKALTRSGYTIDGFDISWECPYLYVFGGYPGVNSSSLNTSVYRGVLERLKFVPSI